jgi:F0F1-type ATP synthase assembly protein I
MEENKKKDKILWVPAVGVFSEISTWIAVPIILAVIGGKALDKNYGTSPWLLIVFAALAFFVSSYGIVKSVKKYASKLKNK